MPQSDNAYKISGATSLQVERLINATPAQLYRAWTDEKLLVLWFAPIGMTVTEARADVRVGGQYRITMQNSDGESYTTYGKYIELVENKKLVFDWGWERPDRHVSTVTVTFEPGPSGTRVRIVHVNHRDAEAAESHTDGWLKCLANLAARVETQALK